MNAAAAAMWVATETRAVTQFESAGSQPGKTCRGADTPMGLWEVKVRACDKLLEQDNTVSLEHMSIFLSGSNTKFLF